MRSPHTPKELRGLLVRAEKVLRNPRVTKARVTRKYRELAAVPGVGEINMHAPFGPGDTRTAAEAAISVLAEIEDTLRRHERAAADEWR